MKNTGFIIKTLRIAEGISQTELAEELGVARSYLSQVENNKREPGLHFLKNVSKFFKIPLVLLFIDESEKDVELIKELRKILSDVLASKIASVKQEFQTSIKSKKN